MKELTCLAAVCWMFAVCAETLTFNTPDDWQQKKYFTENGEGGMTAVFRGPVLSAKMIELEPGKQYFLSGSLKAATDSPQGGILFGFRAYDKQGQHLQAHFCQFVNGSDTELLESTEPSDMYIKVKDASKWKIHAWMVIAWNTKTDKSDLPNRNILQVSPKKIERKDDAWIIHLNKPVNAVLPAGMKIREHSRGGELYQATGSTNKAVKLNKRKVWWWRGVAKVRLLILTVPAKKGDRVKLEVSDLALESK